MQALHLERGACRVTDAPLPERRPGEALIKTRLVGICDTDLQLLRGYNDFVGTPGHEFVGEVVEADDPGLIGVRVVGDINAGCGTCHDCLHRNGHHCTRRTVLGIVQRSGAMAEFFNLPERCLSAVSSAVSDELLVFAEPLAAALHVLDDLPEPSASPDPVIVLGDGKLGLLICWALLSSHRRVLVVGHHPKKLEIAKRLGADVCLESELDEVRRQSDCVVEATGSAQGLQRAISCARPRGTVILKTTIADATPVDLSPLVVNELRLVGSRCGDMVRAVALLVSPEARSLASLVEAQYPLTQAEQAFAHAARPGTLKILLRPGEPHV